MSKFIYVSVTDRSSRVESVIQLLTVFVEKLLFLNVTRKEQEKEKGQWQFLVQGLEWQGLAKILED